MWVLLTELHADDLPSPLYLEHQVHLWHTKWRNCFDKVPAMPLEALLHANVEMFPNLNCLFRIICTLPVTSYECERSIYRLENLPPCHDREELKADRVSFNAHTLYAIDLNLEDIIAKQHPRRMWYNCNEYNSYLKSEIRPAPPQYVLSGEGYPSHVHHNKKKNTADFTRDLAPTYLLFMFIRMCTGWK